MSPNLAPWKLWTAFGFVVLLSVAAMTADRFQALSGFRTVAHDFFSPGRLVVAAISGTANNPGQSAAIEIADPQVARLRDEIDAIESQRRRLLIENARLHNELRLNANAPDDAGGSQRLLGFEVVPARILSRHGMPPALEQLFIDAGRAHGMKRSELVLDGDGFLLDEGAQSGVAEGQQVLQGRTVFGRIERAGRWVSQVQPVTDENFSARVRLTRPAAIPTGQIASGNTEGILEGTGTGCRITGVPYTESVAKGDEVFSADINGVAGPKLYFGRVAEARFESGGEWTVLVEPAAVTNDVQSVTVVCPTLNPSKVEFVTTSGRQP